MRALLTDPTDSPMTTAAAVEGNGGSGQVVVDGRSILPRWAPPWLSTAAVVGVAVVGVLLRLYSRSNLWLDEALSVNIAELPPGDLLEALRHDGHPPLYYLLLHGWMELFGTGDVAVRLLSAVFGVAAFPLAWIAGRRLAGRAGARWALVVVALSPYAVRYSTETRMYSLVMLLVLAGYLVLTDALRQPTLRRLGGVALVSGLLLLTHYWSFWLLGAVGLLLVLRWWRQPAERATSARVIVAVAAGGVLFLPWLGGFLYQMQHTGTPWGAPYRPTALLQATALDMAGGTNFSEAALGAFGIVVLCLLALFVVRARGSQVLLDLRTAPTVRRELGVVVLTLAIGAVTAYAAGATYQSRYAAVIVPFVLLAAAVGITRLPGMARLLAGLGFAGLCTLGIAWVEYFERTQSGPVGAAVAAHAQDGDVVVYCPDQLGPAYSREMPDGLEQVTYPALTSPERVDWVDYQERNEAASTVAAAEEIRELADGHGVFVVWAGGYETYGQQCEDLLHQIGGGAPAQALVTADQGVFYEPANLFWFPTVEP
jgi:mannosyltransferase